MHNLNELISDIRIIQTEDFFHILDCEIIQDTRSAAFYALGVCKKKEQAMMVCRTEVLADTLTAVTEAFYQNLALIIVSVGNQQQNFNMAQCFKCTANIVYSNNEDEIYKIVQNCKEHKSLKPIIIFLKNKNDHDEEKENVFCTLLTNSNSSISWYELSSHAGQLYELLGRAAVSNKNIGIVATAENLKNNLNSLNIRYIRNNLMIVTVDGLTSNELEWIKQCGFEIVEKDSMDLEKCFGNRPIFVLLKGEKYVQCS